MEEEIWKPVPGYEGYYEVSNNGIVRSLARLAKHKTKGGFYPVPPHIMKLHKANTGYLALRLTKDGVHKTVNLHVILCSAFHPNPCGHRCVNHKDGNKLNNALANLEHCSHSQNNKHAYDSGLRKPSPVYGEQHGKAKLTESIVREARELRGAGFTVLAISKKLGVGECAISDMLRGKTWRHVL